MKFQLIVRVCLIFYTYDSANFKKASGITPWKKCYSLLRWPCLLQDNSTDVYCSKQTGSSSTKGNHHHHFFVSGIGQKKTVDAAKICGGAENVVKTETQQTFVNGLLGFITGHLYSAGSACVLLTIIAWVAHRYGQLYLHCSLIYFWVPSSCFCIVISLSWGWNNPVQRCLPVGGRLHYPRRRRWWLHALTDRLPWCATDDDQRQHHHAEHHFQL